MNYVSATSRGLDPVARAREVGPSIAEAADLIEQGMERTIEQKKVTYDFERLMPGATKVSTSEFAGHIIENMDAVVLSATR